MLKDEFSASLLLGKKALKLRYFMEATDQCLTAIKETSDIFERIRKRMKDTVANMIYTTA